MEFIGGLPMWSLGVAVIFVGAGIILLSRVIGDGSDVLLGGTVVVIGLFVTFAILFSDGVLNEAEGSKPKSEEQTRELESVDHEQRFNLVMNELSLNEKDIILYETEAGLYKAQTTKGVYVIEFEDSLEGIAKMIKVED